MINAFFDWIKTNPEKSITVISGMVGLFAGGVWTVLLFFHKFMSEREQKQFERYRLLIRDLNVADDGEAPYIDFQMDAIYQMRFFRRYYPRSLWMLNRLIARWKEKDTGRTNPCYGIGHIDEVEETIAYIAHRKTWLGTIIFFFYDMFPLFQRKETALKRLWRR